MKEMGGIGRWALILLLLGNVYGGFAQDANTARAQHIYELFVAGQGDSIHAALNRELQEKLAPALFMSLPLDLVDPPVVVQPDLLQLLVGALPHQTDPSLTEIQLRVLLLFGQGLLLPLDLPFPPGGLRLEGVTSACPTITADTPITALWKRMTGTDVLLLM